MSSSTWSNIPKSDLDQIRQRLVQQISAMNDAELRIVAQSEQSLATYVAGAFQAIAKLIGYVIAYPIALGISVAKSILQGFADGWDAAFRAAGLD